ncbi:hypothetical protein WJX72_009329 [[Myrmecia] bisecta]|uniref:HIT-type domain-containing protein n=1 Tax=[Myrmecia] bisecta TaxID=41462 RepID=A0AAW1P703_9CHLO
MLRSQAEGSDAGRRSGRTRKVSKRVAVVSELDRQQAAAARLELLENDHAAADTYAEDSDEEFVAPESDEELDFSKSKRKKKQKPKAGKRTTRGQLAERQGPKTFATLLEEAELDQLPPDVPSYLTAAAGPPKGMAPRKWCSVCGFSAPYKCVRCGARFCNKKCYATHVETRCLKFIA